MTIAINGAMTKQVPVVIGAEAHVWQFYDGKLSCYGVLSSEHMMKCYNII